MTSILTVFGKGQVTLPKKFRDRYKTKHFVAQEVAGGMLIKPLVTEDDSVILTETDQEVSLSFNPPIAVEEFVKNLKKACGEI